MRLQRHAHEGEESTTGIDLAPMLDFVLNLLIFFIITAVFVKEIAITASRPTTKAAQSKEAGSIVIGVKSDGSIYVGTREIDLRAVRANIERVHAQKPDDVVLIAAEGDAPSGIVVQVMDQARQGGVDNISLTAGTPK